MKKIFRFWKIKRYLYSLILIILGALSVGSCDKYHDGFIFGAPATGMLMSDWRLDSIVTNSRRASGTDIGYSEMLTIKGENGYRIDRTVRDDSLVNSQYWVARVQPVIDEKRMTFYVDYRSGLKRFYKVYAITSAPDILEATGYVKTFGSKEDSIRYFYRQIWRL